MQIKDAMSPRNSHLVSPEKVYTGGYSALPNSQRHSTSQSTAPPLTRSDLEGDVGASKEQAIKEMDVKTYSALN